MKTEYTGHNDEHVGLQEHSIGSDYPWTISAKHGTNGISYYPWHTISGEHGPRFHVDDCQSTSAYKLAELWIRNRKIDDSQRDEPIQPIHTWKDSTAERSISWNKQTEPEPYVFDESDELSLDLIDVEPLAEYTFLIPLVRDSDRREHDKRANDWLASKLYKTFGGYTLAGTVRGTWKDSNGNELYDDSTVYRVAIEPNLVYKLRRIIESCKIVFDQQTVYVARTSNDCTIS